MQIIIKIIKEIGEFIVEVYKLVVLLLIGLFYGYFILINILTSLFPDLPLESLSLSISNSDLASFILITFALLLISVFLNIKQERFTWVSSISLSKSEQIVYLISSFFLGYFLIKNIAFYSEMSGKLSLLMMTVIALVLFFFLPQVVKLYSSLDFSYFIRLFIRSKEGILQLRVKKNWSRIFYQLIISLFFLSSFIFIVISVTGFIALKANGYLLKQKKLRESFTITKIIPRKTTYAEKVDVYGYNFGWRQNEKYIMQTEYGPFVPSLWNDTKLSFTVPLHWKEGKVNLWLEKTAQESSQSALLQSNKVEMEILSRWDFFPEQSDYEQDFPKYLIRIVKKIKEMAILRWHLF